MIKPWAIILPNSPRPRLGRRTTPSAAAIKKLRLETPTDSPTAIKTLRTVGRRKPRLPQVGAARRPTRDNGDNGHRHGRKQRGDQRRQLPIRHRERQQQTQSEHRAVEDQGLSRRYGHGVTYSFVRVGLETTLRRRRVGPHHPSAEPPGWTRVGVVRQHHPKRHAQEVAHGRSAG